LEEIPKTFKNGTQKTEQYIKLVVQKRMKTAYVNKMLLMSISPRVKSVENHYRQYALCIRSGRAKICSHRRKHKNSNNTLTDVLTIRRGRPQPRGGEEPACLGSDLDFSSDE